VVGIVFLLIIGIMFDAQPFFTNPEINKEEGGHHAAKAAYWGAFIYMISLAVSKTPAK
jgi:hypothetical protein